MRGTAMVGTKYTAHITIKKEMAPTGIEPVPPHPSSHHVLRGVVALAQANRATTTP